VLNAKVGRGINSFLRIFPGFNDDGFGGIEDILGFNDFVGRETTGRT
jgi:hypothetical protein